MVAGGKPTSIPRTPAWTTHISSTTKTSPSPIPAAPGSPTAFTALRAFSITTLSHWTDAAWQAPPLSAAIIYELHVGTFTPEGTLDAAIERLDYLRDLGITHVELMPVAAFPGDHGWGYDGVDLFAVRQPYGGPDALKRFVDACHVRGLAVLLDVVYNHFGPVGNYTRQVRPLSHRRPPHAVGRRRQLRRRAAAIEVRRFFCDNALMWLRDYHFDGLRLDAVHAFVDRSAIHFLEQLATEVDALSGHTRPQLVLIAESDLNDPRLVTAARSRRLRPRRAVERRLPSRPLHRPHRRPRQGLLRRLRLPRTTSPNPSRCVFVYDGAYSSYRESHPRPPRQRPARVTASSATSRITIRSATAPPAIGLSSIVGIDRAKIAAGLVLTAPFIPMLFQGEEFAASTPFQYFADHNPEMGKLVSEGRRREFAAFGWNPAEIPDPRIPRNLPALQTQLGRAHHRASFRNVRTGTRNSSPFAAPRPTSPTPTSPTSRSATATPSNGSSWSAEPSPSPSHSPLNPSGSKSVPVPRSPSPPRPISRSTATPSHFHPTPSLF